MSAERTSRREPAWDAAREEALLSRIESTQVARVQRRVRQRTALTLLGAGLVGVIAWSRGGPASDAAEDPATRATALVATSAPSGAPSDVTPREAASEAVTSPSASPRTSPLATPAAAPAGERLADGSRYEADGPIERIVDSTERVELVQPTGHARYVVSHLPARGFVVRHGALSVEVRGTIFTVDVAAEHVTVGVEEGVVEILDHGAQRAILSAGASERFDLTATSPAAPSPAAASPAGPSPVAARERTEAPRAVLDLEEALREADEARRLGDLDRAATTLTAALAAQPRASSAHAAYFTLGRVERARGHVDAAMRAFESSMRAAPRGPLAEDALAEHAMACAEAGEPCAARDAARYLELHPSGLYAERLRPLAR